MRITITNEQITEMAAALHASIAEDCGSSSEAPAIEEMPEAVENWILRTIYVMSEDPVWYGLGGGSRDVPYFNRPDEYDYRCESTYCRNRPARGSIYCQKCMDTFSDA